MLKFIKQLPRRVVCLARASLSYSRASRRKTASLVQNPSSFRIRREDLSVYSRQSDRDFSWQSRTVADLSSELLSTWETTNGVDVTSKINHLTPIGSPPQFYIVPVSR